MVIERASVGKGPRPASPGPARVEERGRARAQSVGRAAPHEQPSTRSPARVGSPARPLVHPPSAQSNESAAPLERSARPHVLAGRGGDSPMVRALSSPEAKERLAHLRDALGELQRRCEAAAAPFDLHAQIAALDTLEVAVRAGYPCFENGILMPDEPPANWTAHFKPFELAVVEAFLARVAPPDQVREQLHGYVCERGEANQFGIRALIQEHQRRDEPLLPVLVASADAHAGVRIAAEKYGVDFDPIRTTKTGAMDLAHLEAVARRLAQAGRPMVLVATLGTDQGGTDDLQGARAAIERAGARTLIHVDAARSFDFLPKEADGRVAAFSLVPDASGRPVIHSLVAGGLSTQDPAQVAALKPKAIGERGAAVAYVRGLDATISGSRPGIDGLTLHLLEARFGSPRGSGRPDGKAAIAAHAATWKTELTRVARAMGLEASGPAETLDLRIWGAGLERVRPETLEKWGVARSETASGPGAALVLTLGPNVTPEQGEGLVADLWADLHPGRPLPAEVRPRGLSTFDLGAWQVPKEVERSLERTISLFVARAKESAGYPGNQATLPALNALLAPFVTLPLPRKEVARMEAAVLSARLEQAGVDPASSRFGGVVTTGSTMGNQVAIINALAHFPGREPILYMSDQTHYSGEKIASDSRKLRERHRVLPTDASGAIDVAKFAAQLAADAAKYPDAPRILLANHETTFSGAWDDIGALTDAAKAVGAPLDYVHLDGALGLGAGFDRVQLIPPGEAPGVDEEGRLSVQSAICSSHKLPGLKVSGVFLGALPPGHDRFPASNPAADPSAVLQLWAYDQVVTPEMAKTVRKACEANTEYLRRRFADAGLPARGGPGSVITVIDHPPVWLLNKYQLAPEGQHAHVVMMPHVTRALVDNLVRDLSAIPERLARVHERADDVLKMLDPSFSAEVVTRRPIPGELLEAIDALMAEAPGIDLDAGARKAYLNNILNTKDGIPAVLRGDEGRVLGVVIVSQEPDGLKPLGSVLRLAGVPQEHQLLIKDILTTAIAEAVVGPSSSGRAADERA